MEEAIRKADILIEALSYIKKFRGKTFIIKYGGSILLEKSIRERVIQDLVFLYFMGINVVLVHGGGPNINKALKKMNLKSEFYKGIRITDANTFLVVESELMKLNTLLAKELEELGAKVGGVSGKEDLVFARKKEEDIDLGLVGEVADINLPKFKELLDKNHLVVLAPLGRDSQGQVYNINADEVASFLSYKISAEKLVFLTNVKGILRDPADEDSLISSIKEEEVKELIEKKVISEGMIPKVTAGLSAVEKGTKKVHIIDAKIPHALLLEIFTDKGIGTEIIK
ncbi:MAG: acetylglutamate kinase [Candidatus Omnitrophota bacterium]|nr:MAG: acetylglutamate kinase [Candidatus Omnitrophota bacterium]RKY42351.1 MAG: acetylglutamate kinase [Candidatus Omnitrophota bacterium]